MTEEMIVVPELKTERLLLRSMSEDDLGFVLRHFGDKRTNKYSSHGNVRDLDEATDIYERFLKPGQPDRFRLGVTLKETDEIVGTVGLHDYSRRNRRAEIGYDLGAEHWGKGIMTEAWNVSSNTDSGRWR